MSDQGNAFVCEFVAGTPEAECEGGDLDGLRFAVKDNIDVAGSLTGNGCPAWAVGREVAVQNADCVQRLCDAGASLIGKTVLDDLAFSLVGDNRHFGAPVNPQAPDRFCGGSSCGSASAVAQGLVDFALGTDTAGSVRIPASFCGLYGFRPGWGRASMDGVTPLAESLDTVGVLAGSADLLQRATLRLLPDGETEDVLQDASCTVFPRWAFEALPRQVRSVSLRAALDLVDALPGETVIIDDKVPDWFVSLRSSFRAVQAPQVWRNLGKWALEAKPVLSGDTSERLFHCGAAAGVENPSGEHLALQRRTGGEIEQYFSAYGESAIIVWPGAPCLPLRRGSSIAEQRVFRSSVLRFSALAPMTGWAELVLPIVECDDYRLGLGLIARKLSDQYLLELGRRC
jgi:amidase